MCILKRMTVLGRNKAQNACAADKSVYAFTENGIRLVHVD